MYERSNEISLQERDTAREERDRARRAIQLVLQIDGQAVDPGEALDALRASLEAALEPAAPDAFERAVETAKAEAYTDAARIVSEPRGGAPRLPMRFIVDRLLARAQGLGEPGTGKLPQDTAGVPSVREHTIGDYEECVSWCEACRENRERGLNPDGTPRA